MLLCSCITYDFAENTTTISNIESTDNIIAENNITILNNTTVINVNDSASNILVKSSDRIYTSKAKTPTVTMIGKPSCSCGRYYSYRYYTKTYVNYCPNCHHWNCLVNKHKYPARYEQEISCQICDSDFCINCGKEKYGWSSVYLRKA